MEVPGASAGGRQGRREGETQIGRFCGSPSFKLEGGNDGRGRSDGQDLAAQGCGRDKYLATNMSHMNHWRLHVFLTQSSDEMKTNYSITGASSESSVKGIEISISGKRCYTTPKEGGKEERKGRRK